MRDRASLSRKRSPHGFLCAIEALEPRLACAAGISIALARDTGRSTTDAITSDATLVINRALAPGQRLEYRVNGGTFRSAVMTTPRRFVPEGMDVDGTYRVVARIVSARGVPAVTGPAFTLRLDRSADALHVALLEDTGVSASDHISSNARLIVSGQETRAVVQYSQDNGDWIPTTAVWGSYTPKPGLNRWWVRQRDVAGNVSTPVAIQFEFDADRDERVMRMEGPASGAFTASAGQRIAWVLEFEKPMEAAAVNGIAPGIQFTFRGEQLIARLSGGSGTNRLEYAHVFTEGQAGTGILTAPEHACLCYGGIVTDAAGNRIRKHAIPLS